MKEKLTRNFGLKILSIVLAFLIWLIVVNISNPEVTRTKTVPLEIINGNILSDAKKSFEINSGGNITISYEVRARDENKIKSSDFRAYVDIANLYDITGSIPVNIELLNNKDIIDNPTAKPSIVRISTEDVQQKEFSLVANARGELEDGYFMGDITLQPSKVLLSGPVSLIGQISQVGIEVDISQKAENKVDGNASIIGEAAAVFYDANGNKVNIDKDKVSIDTDNVAYKLVLLRGKNLPLNFNVSGNPAEGYRFTGVESSIKNITVIGLKTELANLTTIDIPADLLNIEGATKDKNIVFNAAEFLPDNVRAGGNTEVNLTLKVEQVGKKSYLLDLEDIELLGSEPIYSYKINPDKIELVLGGLKDDLEALNIAELNPRLNVSDMQHGEYKGNLVIDIPNGFDYIDTKEFNVIVSERRKDDNDEIESPGTGADALPKESKSTQ